MGVGMTAALRRYAAAAMFLVPCAQFSVAAPAAGSEVARVEVDAREAPRGVMHVAHEADDKDLDLHYSLGFYVDDEQATIGDVIPGSPADAAGIAPGSHITALNRCASALLHVSHQHRQGGHTQRLHDGRVL